MRLFVALVLLSVLLIPATRAQDGEAPLDALREGTRALSFDLPQSGGTTVGYWRMRSDATSAGLFVRFGGQVDGSGNGRTNAGATLAAGPAVRRYLRTAGEVVPYSYAEVLGSYSLNTFWRDGADDYAQHFLGVNGALGTGLEWFPTTFVSVSGQIGVGLDVQYGIESDGPNSWRLGFGTIVSRLALRLHLLPQDDE